MSFKLTYSTMYNPPAAMHQRFDEALATVRADLGRRHGLYIDGGDVMGESFISKYSPADTELLLGHFSEASAEDAVRAVAAARAAYPAWRALPMGERLALLRRAAALIEERVYLLSAALAMEVGKNRMEALGEVQETADLVRWYCEQMQANDGFDRVLPDDPLPGWRSHNRTRLRPHGVWAVIAPFNFPFALAGGPIAAALVAGNTVVFKVASDTAGSGVALMQAFHDAGLPDGVLNHLMGPGDEVGVARDDRRVLATHLGDAGTRPATLREAAQDAHADRVRTGEGGARHVGMAGQRVPGRGPRPGHEVHYAVGQAGVAERFEQQPATERGVAGDLEHDGVAGGQRRADRPAGQREREVERRDHGPDAVGLQARAVAADEAGERVVGQVAPKAVVGLHLVAVPGDQLGGLLDFA